MRLKPISVILISALAALSLTACNEQASRSGNEAPPPPTAFAAPGQSEKNAARHLAIEHSFVLRMPSQEIARVHREHVEACEKLGCIILSRRIDHDTKASAYLAARIPPEAFPTFERAISTGPLKVASHQETSEDKTLPLLDVEKRLEAKTALRDRLTALLKEPGQRPIGELAALEKQISDIQGEIESATAQRDYLKTITETIKVEVTYFGQPDTVAGIDFSPLRWAFSDSLVTLIGSAAQLVTFIAAALPWLPLFAFVFWLGRRWRRRASSTA